MSPLFVSRRRRDRRRPKRFRPECLASGPEALERRDVPAVITGPWSWATSPFVSATISENAATNQITAVFSLTAAGLAANYSTPVGLALYSIGALNVPPPPPGVFPTSEQVRILNAQGLTVLDAAHPTITITVGLPLSGGSGVHCVQADAYFGGPGTAGMILDTASNDLLNSHLLAALVDCSSSGAPFTGLTPGYYKNHLGAITALGLDPNTTTVNDVFGFFGDFAAGSPYASLANDSLLTVLNYQGGPGLVNKAQILLRQALTAFFNASSSAINYPLTAYQVIQDVHDALSTATAQDPAPITNLAALLDSYNSAEGVDLGFPNTTSGSKKP